MKYKTWKDVQKLQTLPRKEREAKLSKFAEHNAKCFEKSEHTPKSVVVDSVWTREDKGRYTDGFVVKVTWSFESKKNKSGERVKTKAYSVYAYPPKE